MIKEIELLLPLLQQAGEGAFWSFVVFIAYRILSDVAIVVVVLGVAYLASNTVTRLKRMDYEAKNPLNLDYLAARAMRDAWLNSPQDDMGTARYRNYKKWCEEMRIKSE